MSRDPKCKHGAGIGEYCRGINCYRSRLFAVKNKPPIEPVTVKPAIPWGTVDIPEPPEK